MESLIKDSPKEDEPHKGNIHSISLSIIWRFHCISPPPPHKDSLILVLQLFASVGFISEPHDPEIDAIASIRLFNTYNGKPSKLEQAKKQLQSVRPPPSFAKRNDYRYEGVCMAAYYPAKCFCGAPTKK